MSYYREGGRRRRYESLARCSECGVCWVTEPDRDGMRDLVENDRCPVHGDGRRLSVRRGSFGWMLQSSKEDRDAAA